MLNGNYLELARQSRLLVECTLLDVLHKYPFSGVSLGRSLATRRHLRNVRLVGANVGRSKADAAVGVAGDKEAGAVSLPSGVRGQGAPFWPPRAFVGPVASACPGGGVPIGGMASVK